MNKKELSYKKILVGFDGSNTDKKLVDYVSFLVKIIEPTKILFYHVSTKQELPKELISTTSEKNTNDPQKKLKEEINKYFEEEYQKKISIESEEGSRLALFLSKAKSFDADLIIIGRKNNTKNQNKTEVILSRLSRRAPCSVLIVPETSKKLMDNVLVCTDFSESSQKALKVATNLTKKLDYVTVYSHHIYSVPVGYHATGKSFEEVAHIMKLNAAKKLKGLLKSADINQNKVTPIYTLDRKNKPTQYIIDAAKSIQASLVIAGARGLTYAASIFIGSFSEKLIKIQKNTPLLIVREKNEIMGILKAIKSL